MAAADKQPVTVTWAGPRNGDTGCVLTWDDQRFPLMSLRRVQLGAHSSPTELTCCYCHVSMARLVSVAAIASHGSE